MEKVLIFDYDGVIADSKAVFMRYFLEACEKYGVNISTEEEFLRLYEGNVYESMLSLGLTKKKILSVVYYMREGLMKNRDKIRIFPGIKDVLKTLSSYPLFIVTSNDTEVVKTFITEWDIDFFEEIIGSDREASKVRKIEYVMKKYPHALHFFIGDTAGDILEGRKAGVKTVAAIWGWHDMEKLSKAKPDYIATKPSHLLEIF